MCLGLRYRRAVLDLKEMFPRGVRVFFVLSHVPDMHVIVDGLSSTIFTAAHPAAMGGIVTKETCQTDSELKADRKKTRQINVITERCRLTHTRRHTKEKIHNAS